MNIKTRNKKLSIGAKVIKDLGINLPDHYIALNELTKNSFDACAKNVSIIFDSSKKTLTIEDDGSGMDFDGLETLMKISSSKKEYGSIISDCNRRTQGSKGFGFLAAFKFGNKVTWTTQKNNQLLELVVDYNELLKLEEINNKEFDVFISTVNKNKHFTKITINMEDQHISEFLEFYSEKTNLNKTLYSFSPEVTDFKIHFSIDGNNYSNTGYKDINHLLNKNQSDRIMYNVKYNNESNQFRFYHDNVLLESFESLSSFDFEDATIELDLYIYSFKSGGTSTVNPIFKNKSDETKIFPIVYINNNLFVSELLFDPEIKRKKKGGGSLPQIIGTVNILSNNSNLEFDSNRTTLVKNTFTNSMIDFLFNLNTQIQDYGSQNKFGLIPESKSELINDFEQDKKFIDSDEYNLESIAKSLISPKFSYPDSISAIISGENISFYFADEKLKEIRLLPLKKDYSQALDITLYQNEIYLYENNPTYNLRNNIKTYQNTTGDKVYDDIIIKLNSNVVQDDLFFPAQHSDTTQIIEYSYTDIKTKLLWSEKVNIHISTKSKPYKLISDSQLITSPYQNEYSITFNNSVIDLVNQNNYLYKYIEDISKIDPTSNIKNFNAVIACNLRTIYELSLVSFYESFNLESEFLQISSFEDKLDYFFKKFTKNIVTKLATALKTNYSNLENILITSNPIIFISNFKTTNTTTHTSTKFLDESFIIESCKYIGHFILIIETLIVNANIFMPLF